MHTVCNSGTFRNNDLKHHNYCNIHYRPLPWVWSSLTFSDWLWKTQLAKDNIRVTISISCCVFTSRFKMVVLFFPGLQRIWVQLNITIIISTHAWPLQWLWSSLSSSGWLCQYRFSATLTNGYIRSMWTARLVSMIHLAGREATPLPASPSTWLSK